MKRDTNPRHPQDGVYIRNISPDDDFRLRIPKSIISELGMREARKLAIHVNERGQLIIEPLCPQK